MKYTDLLTKHDIDPKKLSPALKRLVAEYKQVDDEIIKGEEKLQGGKLSDSRKQKLEQDLEEARETLEQVNEALCTSINEWLANREKNLAKGQALAAARQLKKNGTASSTPAGSGAATPAATTAAIQTPAQSATPAATAPATSSAAGNSGQQASDGNQTPATKKSNSGWVIGGIFISLLLLVGGVAYHNHQKNSI